MTYNTTGGPIELIHPRELVKLIARDKVYQTVQQYHQPTPNIASNIFQGYGSSSANATATYTRSVKTVRHYTDEEDFLLTEFVMDMHQNKRLIDTKPRNFVDALEDATVECLQNFGCPTHAILFGDNVMVVGEFSADAICLKEVGPNYGALITYMPNKFTVIHSPEKCQYMTVEPKYNKYVSNVLLMQTMNRLGLHE